MLSLAIAVRLRRTRRYAIVESTPTDFLALAALGPSAVERGSCSTSTTSLRTCSTCARRSTRNQHRRQGVRFVKRSATRAASAVLTVHEPYSRRAARARSTSVEGNRRDERPGGKHPLDEPAAATSRATASGRLPRHSDSPTPGRRSRRARPGSAACRDLQLEVHGTGDPVRKVSTLADRLSLAGDSCSGPSFSRKPRYSVSSRAPRSASTQPRDAPQPLRAVDQLLEYVAWHTRRLCDLATMRTRFRTTKYSSTSRQYGVAGGGTSPDGGDPEAARARAEQRCAASTAIDRR